MFKIFTASDFSAEIIKALSLTSYSVQMLVDVNDLKIISKSVFELLELDIQAEIIISANTKSKSLVTMNIINRLIDFGANVYWNQDHNIFELKSHFLISDKKNVINKIFYRNQDLPKDQVLYFLSIFEKIRGDSEEIIFNDKNIHVTFESDKTIVKKNEKIKILWDVKNADTIKITPILGTVDYKNETQIQLGEETQFKLEAQNSNESVMKLLHIKIIEPDYFKLNVKVYDPILKEYIFLEAKNISSVDNYVCYHSQDVTLCFDYGNSTNVTEDEIGPLNNVKEISFNLRKKKIFVFRYNEDDTRKIKKVQIVPCKDLSLLKYFVK